jgi:anti-sigma regulatory factor (Ser/Thr protein kinase)
MKSFRDDWLRVVRFLAASTGVDRRSPTSRSRPDTPAGRASKHSANERHARYRHDVLVHEDDEDLVAGTRAFVEQGLVSGGQVLVHGTRDRVGLLRDVLGDHPRLEYGFDDDLYQAPTRTLFEYQRRLAEMPEPLDFWVTGTVPLGHGPTEQAAWSRYESAVNEALSAYSFRALCTYDTRTNPPSVIEAALATHPGVNTDLTSRPSDQYVDPARFLTHPLAGIPEPSQAPPSLVMTVAGLDDLAQARYLLKTTALASSALPLDAVGEFIVAVNEVAANGVAHGAPPVRVTLWADPTRLTCQVRDSGAGTLDPLTGFRYPDEWGPMGLWVARQLVDDLFITPSVGGCSILLVKA